MMTRRRNYTFYFICKEVFILEDFKVKILILLHPPPKLRTLPHSCSQTRKVFHICIAAYKFTSSSNDNLISTRVKALCHHRLIELSTHCTQCHMFMWNFSILTRRHTHTRTHPCMLCLFLHAHPLRLQSPHYLFPSSSTIMLCIIFVVTV